MSETDQGKRKRPPMSQHRRLQLRLKASLRELRAIGAAVPAAFAALDARINDDDEDLYDNIPL